MPCAAPKLHALVVLSLALVGALACDTHDSEATSTTSLAEPAPSSAEPAPSPAEPAQDPPEEPAKAARKPMPLKLSISGEGCSIMGADARECAELCEDAEVFRGVDAVIIETSDGGEAQLETVLSCLRTMQIATTVRGEGAPPAK